MVLSILKPGEMIQDAISCPGGNLTGKRSDDLIMLCLDVASAERPSPRGTTLHRQEKQRPNGALFTLS